MISVISSTVNINIFIGAPLIFGPLVEEAVICKQNILKILYAHSVIPHVTASGESAGVWIRRRA